MAAPLPLAVWPCAWLDPLAARDQPNAAPLPSNPDGARVPGLNAEKVQKPAFAGVAVAAALAAVLPSMSPAALGTGGGLPPALLLLSPAGRVDPAALLPPFAAAVVVVDPLHVLPAGACDLVGEICPTYIGCRYSGRKLSRLIRREFLKRTTEKKRTVHIYERYTHMQTT